MYVCRHACFCMEETTKVYFEVVLLCCLYFFLSISMAVFLSFFISFLSNLTYLAPGSTSQIKPPSQTHMFSMSESKVLLNHVIYVERSVAEVTSCIKYCMLVDTCKSVNFGVVDHVCEMSNATASDALDTKVNYQYWEKVAFKEFSLE